MDTGCMYLYMYSVNKRRPDIDHKHCLNLHAVYVGTIWFMDFSRNQSIYWVNDFSPPKKTGWTGFLCVYLYIQQKC